MTRRLRKENKNMKYLKKNEKMRKLFGETEGKQCIECKHFRRWKSGKTNVRKCEMYGITLTTSTDWKGNYPACGLFPDKEKPFNKNVMRMKIPHEESLKGQISTFSDADDKITEK